MLCQSSKEEERNYSSLEHSHGIFIHEEINYGMMDGRHIRVRNPFSLPNDSFSMSTPLLKEKLLLAANPRPLWFWKAMHEEKTSWEEFIIGSLQHIMECKFLQQFEEVLPFSQEPIEDGGHPWMDNISHDCVGHFLSHAHHDGRFFPTTYLGPHRVKLILGNFKIP